jgi:hypothetical protein
VNINLSSIEKKLGRGDGAIVGEKEMKRDMKLIYDFLIVNESFITGEMRKYFEENNEFDLLVFSKYYFSNHIGRDVKVSKITGNVIKLD